MLFRISSNLFLSVSLIWEVCNVHRKKMFKLFFQVLKIVWSPIRDWLYFTLLRIFHISHFEIHIIILKMTSKSSLPYSPSIIFDSLISILAVNPDLLNIASISFITFFTEGHLKNSLIYIYTCTCVQYMLVLLVYKNKDIHVFLSEKTMYIKWYVEGLMSYLRYLRLWSLTHIAYPMLTDSLDCPFMITPSGFSIVYRY